MSANYKVEGEINMTVAIIAGLFFIGFIFFKVVTTTLTIAVPFIFKTALVMAILITLALAL